MGGDTIALEDAIALISSQIAVHGYGLNRTKLVKLLYFLDIEAWEQIGRPVTGVGWVWHNYGPYSSAVLDACDRMDDTGELSVDKGSNAFGSPEYDIQSKREMYYRPPSEELVRLVRSLVREYGPKNATELKNLSYETEPMRQVIEHGAKGDAIEFSPRPIDKREVREAIARYAAFADMPRSQDEGDVAADLRDEIEALEPARRSGTSKVLGD